MFRSLRWILLVVCILQTVAAVHGLELKVISNGQEHFIDFGDWEYKEIYPFGKNAIVFAVAIPWDNFVTRLKEIKLPEDILSTGTCKCMTITNKDGDYRFTVDDKLLVAFQRPAGKTKQPDQEDYIVGKQWIVGSQQTEDKVVAVKGVWGY